VLLVDFHLDQENGLDVLKKVAEKFGRSLPAAFITADHSEQVRQTIRDAGFLFLRKPVKPAALRATLTSLLRAREAA